VDRFPVRAYDTKHPVGYKAWWNYPALPKFNTDSPAVREFLWDIGEKWIAFGADGWRLDVPNEIDDDSFWREFRRRVKAKAPDAYIVGEIWEDARRWLRGDQFDAVMNYLFTRLALGFFGAKTLNVATINECGLKDTVPLNAEDFARGVEGLLELYPWEVTLAQMNLLDSHDTPRFISAVSGDKEAFKLATLFQMAYPGAPCVYYGDEVGVEGLHDPDCRRGMPWAESDWDADLLRYVSRAIALRKSVPALRRGRYRTLQASGMQYAFERHLETQGSWAVVVLNAGTAAATFRLSGLTDGRYRDAWDGGEFLVRNGDLELKGVKARSGLLLVKQ
jgi:cyclomaltodextrinase